MTVYTDKPFSCPPGYYHARIRLTASTDRFMRGDRYGTIIARPTTHIYRVHMDRSGDIIRVHTNNFEIMESSIQ